MNDILINLYRLSDKIDSLSNSLSNSLSSIKVLDDIQELLANSQSNGHNSPKCQYILDMVSHTKKDRKLIELDRNQIQNELASFMFRLNAIKANVSYALSLSCDDKQPEHTALPLPDNKPISKATSIVDSVCGSTMAIGTGSSTQTNSGQQHNMFMRALTDNGFVNLMANSKKSKKRDKLDNKPPGLYFIEEPNGHQKSPDFILYNKKEGGELLEQKVECKKSDGTTIIWNDGFPQLDTLYIVSLNTKKPNRRTAWLRGCDLFDQSAFDISTETKQLHKHINYIYRTKCDTSQDGWYHTTRSASSQRNIDKRIPDKLEIINVLTNFIA